MNATADDLHVLYRDDELLVLDKPAALSLFADRTGAGELWPAIAALAAPHTPRPVHRLDKGTSGVLVVALAPATQQRLNRAFADRSVSKYYVARVAGRLDVRGSAMLDLPVMKGRKSRYRIAGPRDSIVREETAGGTVWRLSGAAHPDAKEAVTRVRVLDHDADSTRLLLHPRTGRTHQLRVHLAWIGHPILGDMLYGRPTDPAQAFDRLALHCHRMCVPVSDTHRRSFVAPLPSALAGPGGPAPDTGDA